MEFDDASIDLRVAQALKEIHRNAHNELVRMATTMEKQLSFLDVHETDNPFTAQLHTVYENVKAHPLYRLDDEG